MSVREIDINRNSVLLDSGDRIVYEQLLIASGARPRRLPGLDSALYLRNLADAKRLRDLLHAGDRISIIGAGFIGCEVAAAARKLGKEVIIYEASSQPLVRAVGVQIGRYIAELHRSNGVTLFTGVNELPQLDEPILASVGSEPRTELAADAGLRIDGGIQVDGFGRTSAPDIYAAGDVARAWNPLFETYVRVEHFQTAWRHGVAVGRVMAGGAEPFSEAPWFWSDQYDTNIQYVGVGSDWDQMLVRGQFGRPPFTVFYMKDGRLKSALGVNDRRTINVARHLLESRLQATEIQLEDSTFDLKGLLKNAQKDVPRP